MALRNFVYIHTGQTPKFICACIAIIMIIIIKNIGKQERTCANLRGDFRSLYRSSIYSKCCSFKELSDGIKIARCVVISA